MRKESTMMNISEHKISELDRIFNHTRTENGDKAYISTGNHLIDILFGCEYYTHNANALTIGNSNVEKLFSMFIRDPRHGLGYKNVGRKLMALSGCTPDYVVKAGGFKDFRETEEFFDNMFDVWQGFIRKEIESGNELAKKWCPRYASKNLMLARRLAKAWGMTKQEYGKFIKCDTVESKLSSHKSDEIVFEHVPSKAMLKYYKRFSNGEDTKERFAKYLDNVRKGEAKLNVSVTNVYDLYRAAIQNPDFDADLFFSKIEKVEGSWLPIVDTSSSMFDDNDAFGKAMAIGHYLAKTSTYCPNKALTFSSEPQLVTLGQTTTRVSYRYRSEVLTKIASTSNYGKELKSMFTGDCSNTDFGAVMNILSKLERDYPDYLVVLSDMQFDCGSANRKDTLMRSWKSKGIKTKIVWWNLNARSVSSPETDEYGNVFMSGYSPMLLKYMSTEFNATDFLETLLTEYAKKIVD